MDIFEKFKQVEDEAEDFGFKWSNAKQIIEQIKSECSEVGIHLDDENRQKLQDEVGDLLHAAFSLCIFVKLDLHETLVKSLEKFERRFHKVKALAKAQGLVTLKTHSFSELMNFWDQAKKETD